MTGWWTIVQVHALPIGIGGYISRMARHGDESTIKDSLDEYFSKVASLSLCHTWDFVVVLDNGGVITQTVGRDLLSPQTALIGLGV